MADRDQKALDNMSFKQRKKEWNNAKRRLEPENEYLEAMVKNLRLKLEHKKLLEEFEESYSDQLEEIEEDKKLRSSSSKGE